MFRRFSLPPPEFMLPAIRIEQLLIRAVLLLLCAVGTAQAETWTDLSGKLSVEAEFIGVEERSVVLKRSSGKIVKVPIAKLSEASRAQAKTLYRAMLEEAKARRLPHENRPKTPRVEPTDVISPNTRWNFQFVAANQETYAKLLDHYKLELATISGEKKTTIEYLRDLSSKQPKARRGDIASDKRQPFLPASKGPLHEFHRAFFQKADLEVEDRTFVILIDDELNKHLQNLELIQLKRNGYDTLGAVQRTLFHFEHDGFDFALAVMKQTYRVP